MLKKSSAIDRLLKETAKLLHENNKHNMIIWCFKDNLSAIKFYKDMGGVEVSEKEVTMGDDNYIEVCFYYDLESLNKIPFKGIYV